MTDLDDNYNAALKWQADDLKTQETPTIGPSIDFAKEIADHRSRTEVNLPYTKLKIEDVMFISNTRLASIEYIFYQCKNNVKYYQLNECKTNFLNTNSFRKKSDSNNQPGQSGGEEKNMHYKRKPICYAPSDQEYFKGKSTNAKTRFLDTPNGDAKVETLLCLWKITYNGQLEKQKQINISYDAVFMPSIKGQMKLRLSNDKELIFLPVIKSYGDKCKQIQLLCWDLNLQEIAMPKKFDENLMFKFEQTIGLNSDGVEMVGAGKYVMIQMTVGTENLFFFIFDATTGNQVLMLNNQEMSNRILARKPQKKPKKKEAEQLCGGDKSKFELHEQTLCCLDLIVEEPFHEITNKRKKTSFNKQVDSPDGSVISKQSSYGSLERVDYENQERQSLRQPSLINLQKITSDSVDKDKSAMGPSLQRTDSSKAALMSKISMYEEQLRSAEKLEVTYETKYKSVQISRESTMRKSTEIRSRYLAGILSPKASIQNLDTKQGQDTEQIAQKLRLGSNFENTSGIKQKQASSSNSQQKFEGGEEESFNDSLNSYKNDLNLVFFFAADFGLDDQNWVMCQYKVTLKELKEKSHKGKEGAFLKEQGKLVLSNLKLKENKFMRIPSNWFLSENGDPTKWTGKIKLTANKYSNMIGVFNDIDKTYMGFMLRKKDSWETFTKEQFPAQSDIQLSRNQITKFVLMITKRVYGEGCTTYAFFGKDKKKQLMLSVDHQFARTDCRLLHQDLDQFSNKYSLSGHITDYNIDKYYRNCGLQSCSLTQEAQEIYFKSHIPIFDENSDNFNFKVVKNGSISQRHQGSFPIFMYNVGQRKIIIQQCNHQKRTMVYELPQDEIFSNFVKFNNFSDFGFDPFELKDEGCSYFVFTTSEYKKKRTFLNVMLIDPYYDDIQISLFKSSTFVDQSNFPPQVRDQIIETFMYKTNNKIKIVRQYNSFIKEFDFEIQKASENPVLELNQSHASYREKESDDESYPEVEQQEKSCRIETFQEQVQMVLNNRGFVYYVVSQEGQCIIKEINPQNESNEHTDVYEIKSDKCFGFGFKAPYYYFIDSQKVIHQLRRSQETGMFVKEAEFFIKPSERSNFKQFPNSQIVIQDQYLINNQRIFYLYDSRNQPLQVGILDMDLLTDADSKNDEFEKSFVTGPITFQGSQQYMAVFKCHTLNESGNASQSYIVRIYQRPDSTIATLINDMNKDKVSMSTFITGDGQYEMDKVLIQLHQRYLLFDIDGNFLDQVDFTHQTKEQIQEAAHSCSGSPNCKDETSEQSNDDGFSPIKKNSLGIMEKEYGEIMKCDKMSLIGMNRLNQHFLFEDRLKRELGVYTLERKIESTERKQKRKSKSKISKGMLNQHSLTSQATYHFVLDYTLSDFFTSNMFFLPSLPQIYTSIDVSDDSQYLYFHKLLDNGDIDVVIEEHGRVIVDSEQQMWEVENDTQVKCKFAVWDKGIPRKTYAHETEFDHHAKRDLNNIFDNESAQFDSLITAEQRIQQRLPAAFRDNQLIKKLQTEKEQIKVKKNASVNASIFGNYLFMNYGRLLKYTVIDDQMLIENKSNNKPEMTDLNVNFNNCSLITGVFKTKNPDIFQIVSKDLSQNHLIILTWDASKHIEVSMFQIRFEHGQMPEYYITTGMNSKMNYFVDLHQIFDLEYNIPYQESTNTQEFLIDSTTLNTSVFNRQRKIYKNSSRNLGINSPNLINFPVTQIDLLLWKNINSKKEKLQAIRDCTRPGNYNLIFGTFSLFHYYAGETAVISLIHDIFEKCHNDGNLMPGEKNIPLVLLLPDQNGDTALEKAVQAKRPKCFELLVCLLQHFDEFSVSKMMLKSLSKLLQQDSNIIFEFFDQKTYKPLLLQEAFIIYWPEDLEEHLFVSHTSIITKDMLQESIDGGIKVDDNRDKDQGISQKRVDPEDLRSFDLIFHEEEETTQLQRVSVEILDLDWIFQNNNTEVIITMLATIAEEKLFVSKQFKSFIILMWSYYQPAIIKKTCCPYILYMVTFGYMVAYVTTDLLDSTIIEDGSQHGLFWSLIFLLLTDAALWTFFFLNELRNLRDNPQDYIEDPWNYVDVIGIFLQASFMISTIMKVFFQQDIVSDINLRAIGAITMYFFWIKSFFWMRIFSSYAHFITLITKTVLDAKTFIVMLILIVCAYANFFHIINLNTPSNPKYTKQHQEDLDYVDEYTYVNPKIGIKIIDSLIAAYLMGLGDFSYDNYIYGDCSLVVWCFFLSATFIICVVFMNMLIAIMGNTFGTVQEFHQQSIIKEQVMLMKDFMWLIDLKSTFAEFKYIVRIVPETCIIDSGLDIASAIDESQAAIIVQNTKQHEMVMKSYELLMMRMRVIESSEKDNCQMLKHIQRHITDIEEKQKQDGQPQTSII